MRNPSFIRTFAVAAFALGGALHLLGCGGSRPATSAGTMPVAAKPAPALPTDPWTVVPDGASTLLRVDMVALRASPHLTFAREWTRSAGCLSPDQESVIFERTESLVAVQWAGEGGTPARNLLVAKGAYTDQDVASALGLAAALTGSAPQQPAIEGMHGRHRALTRDALSAARIGEALLVLGDTQSVKAALDMADGKTTDGKTARLYDGELITLTGVREELANSSAVLVTKSNERVVKGTGRALGSVGLPRDLAQGTLVMIARLQEQGLRLEGRVARPSAASAVQAADTIRSRLGQINMLARLAGLPGVLGSAEVRAEAEVLHVTLFASHDDLTILRERLRDLIADQPTCDK